MSKKTDPATDTTPDVPPCSCLDAGFEAGWNKGYDTGYESGVIEGAFQAGKHAQYDEARANAAAEDEDPAVESDAFDTILCRYADPTNWGDSDPIGTAARALRAAINKEVEDGGYSQIEFGGGVSSRL